MSDNNCADSPSVTRKRAKSASDEGGGKRKKELDTSAKGIIKLAEKAEIELFHTRRREAFVTFYVRGHWETRNVKCTAFREWLCGLCYDRKGFVASQRAVQEAISTLAGLALYGRPEKQVYTRLAESDGAIYVDLGNDSWAAAKITSEGWEIVPCAPVKFVRAPGMLALPRPRKGGNINDLRPILNLTDEDDWKLAVGWMIAALKPTGPFLLLVVQGTHGSAKSTTARLLRSLLDPNEAPLRSEPRDTRDLAISANNGWCLGFDNLSTLRPWFSDALCRVSTGGGFSTRALYTDGEEKIFEGTRPVVMTGIDIGINREDLMDRCLFLSLAPIEERNRQTEATLRERFDALYPAVLGSLFDAVACALRRLPEVKLASPPRMADFATWVCAAEPALGWPEGEFLAAYRRNRSESNALALEVSPLTIPVRQLVGRASWEGTATHLRSALLAVQTDEISADDVEPFPKNPWELSKALRRLAPNLLQAGISVEFDAKTPGNYSKRIIKIKAVGDAATQASH